MGYRAGNGQDETSSHRTFLSKLTRFKLHFLSYIHIFLELHIIIGHGPLLQSLRAFDFLPPTTDSSLDGAHCCCTDKSRDNQHGDW